MKDEDTQFQAFEEECQMIFLFRGGSIVNEVGTLQFTH